MEDREIWQIFGSIETKLDHLADGIEKLFDFIDKKTIIPDKERAFNIHLNEEEKVRLLNLLIDSDSYYFDALKDNLKKKLRGQDQN